MSAYITQPTAGGNAGELVVNVDSTQDVLVTWGGNVDVMIGRGTTDTDITFIQLRQADGTAYKVYVASGTITTTTGTL